MVVHVFRHPVRGFFETFMFVHVHVFSMLCPLWSWLSCSWSMISSMFPWLSYSSWFVVFMSSWFLTCGVHVHVHAFMFMCFCSCVHEGSCTYVFILCCFSCMVFMVVESMWCAFTIIYMHVMCKNTYIYIFIDIYYVHWQILNLNMYSLYQ